MDDEETRDERVRVSVTQVLAGALAAMVASLVASRLGIGGTIIGTAVFSVVATVITAVNMNSVAHVRERARTARLAAARARSESVGGSAGEPVAAADSVALSAADEEADRADQEAEEHGRFTVADRRGYHWGVIAGVSALMFVFAMVGITVVEKITGKAIACSFGRDCDDPTTIPLPGQPKPSATPSESPSPSDSPSIKPTVSPTPTPTPSPTPTVTPSSSPTPTVSVTTTPSPSVSGAAPASPSP